MDYPLLNLIMTRSGGLQPVVDALNDLLENARLRYNSEIGPRVFGRLPTETVPTAPRQLTEFRARVGGLIEHVLGMIVDDMLGEEHRERLRLSFVVSHQYPDFYVRNEAGQVLLRIECKALHVESDEYSARFATPTAVISAVDDVLIYVAWQWKEVALAGHPLVFPEVVEGLCVPAIEIAQERDLRLQRVGGRIAENGEPYVPSRTAPDRWNKDTNFGKIDRIVHRSRHRDELTPAVQRFVDFAQRYTAARARSNSATAPSPDELPPT